MSDVRWLQVPGYPEYEVSENGLVSRGGSILKPCRMKRGGYIAVSLWQYGKGKTWPVHQLVCMAFHGPRPTPKHHAAHDDGDKDNNHESNVLWKTKKENEADKVRHGRTNRGDKNWNTKIKDADVPEVVRRIAELPSSSGGRRIKKGALPKLAAEYGVTASCLRQIHTGIRRSP